jgi:hypothetical protein
VIPTTTSDELKRRRNKVPAAFRLFRLLANSGIPEFTFRRNPKS